MLSARLNEGVHAVVDIFICVGRRDLDSDSGFALWDDWVGETNHVHSCGREGARVIDGAHIITNAVEQSEMRRKKHRLRGLYVSRSSVGLLLLVLWTLSRLYLTRDSCLIQIATSNKMPMRKKLICKSEAYRLNLLHSIQPYKPGNC